MSIAAPNCNRGTARELIWRLLFFPRWGSNSPQFPFGEFAEDILAIKQLSCMGKQSGE